MFGFLNLYFEFDTSLLRPLVDQNAPRDFAFQNKVQKLRKEIMEHYYSERLAILDVILSILLTASSSQSDQKYNRKITGIAKELIDKAKLGEVLWKSYKFISEANPPEGLTELVDTEEWTLQNLKEQYHILKILYILYHGLQDCSPDTFMDMLTVFHNQSFRGSLLRYKNQVTLPKYDEQRHAYADMMGDLCLLTLMNSLNMGNIFKHSKSPFAGGSQTENPLALILAKGKDITKILNDGYKTNIYFPPLIEAWRRLLLWYKDNTEDDKVQKMCTSYAEECVIPTDYLSLIRDMKRRRIFLVSENDILLNYFRLTIREWVSLLTQDISSDQTDSYEKLVDLACECLKPDESLDAFWSHDINYDANLSGLLHNLLSLFPLKSTRMIKFVTALLGSKHNNYATHVLRLLGQMECYTCELPDSVVKLERPQGSRSRSETTSGKILEPIKAGFITIPKGTTAKLLDRSERTSVYQFNVRYNFWHILYQNWTRTIQQLRANEIKKFNNPMIRLVKLVCKMLIYDPMLAELIEESLMYEERPNKICNSSSVLILLLLDTLYYFQRLPEYPYKLLALILKALAALESHLHYSATLAAMIQIYPRTIILPNTTPYGTTSMSNLKSSTMMREPMVNKYNDLVHPILEVFYTLKRAENPIENSTKRYNIYIALLQFAYQIILNNEFIFNRYSNEKFARVFFGSNMMKINNVMDQAGELIDEIHRDAYWGETPIQALNDLVRQKQGSVQFYSTFIDDLFDIIYVKILPNLDKMIFTPDIMDKKWKIGSLLFKITDLLLQKFVLSLDRNLIVTNSGPSGTKTTGLTKPQHENILLAHISEYLNASRLTDFILKTLEVVVNPAVFRGRITLNSDKENPLGIENTFWMSYIMNQNMDQKQVLRGRDLIAQCLSCLEIIINLIEVYHETPLQGNIVASANEFLMEVGRLNVVDDMERILTKKEHMHHYVYQQHKDPIHINLILSLFAYVNFENIKYINPVVKYDPQTISNIQKTLGNTMASEDEIYETGLLLSNMNPELARNLFLKNRLKSNQNAARVCTLALRVITRLILLWEDQSVLHKPLLYEYISSISSWDKNFNSDTILEEIFSQFINVLYDFESQPEDASAALELLIVCIHTQRPFVDLFLKSTLKSISNPQATFCGFIDAFFYKPVEKYKPLLAKIIIFLREVFTLENHYGKVVETLRNNGQLMQRMFSSVFKHLNSKYSITDLLNEYCAPILYRSASANELKRLPIQFEKLRVEGLIMKECSNIFATMVAIRFMTQEMLKSSKSNVISKYIHGIIQEFFTDYFESWLAKFTTEASYQQFDANTFRAFQEEFANRQNLENYSSNNEDMTEEMHRSSIHETSYMTGYSNIRLQRGDVPKNMIALTDFKVSSRKYREEKGDKEMEEEEKTTNGAKKKKIQKPYNIMEKGVYKILDVNLYGYGRDYLYDTQEVYHALRTYHYKEEFIYYTVAYLNKYNLHQSLMAIEHKYFDSIVKLFKFSSTLGQEGKCFSTVYYDLSETIFPKYPALEDVFDNDKERLLANPNYKTSFTKGFIDLFTKQTNDLTKVDSCTNFLVKCVKIIWKSLQNASQKDEVNLLSLQNVEQKLHFLSYAFNALFYLMKIGPKLKAKITTKGGIQITALKKDIIPEEKTWQLDKGLLELIKDLFQNLNQTGFRKFSESKYYVERDNTQYIIFLMIYFHSVLESRREIKFDPTDTMRYLIYLENAIKPNTACLSIIITCFQQLFRLDSDNFYSYLVNTQSKLIKLLINKLNSDLCTDTEFIFILKFFTELAGKYKLAILLKEQNIMWELSSNKQFKGLKDLSNYECGVRTSRHFYWCWTLILVKEITKTLHKEAGMIYFPFLLILLTIV